MTTISFIVPGEPVGKGRARSVRRGKFIAHYTPEKTANYENLVKIAASAAMGGFPMFDGPCDLLVMARVTVPASWSKKRRDMALAGTIRPTTKPDLDNILKGISDAMNGIVFVDDKQVVKVTMEKFYAETPLLRVAVSASKLSID